MINFKALKNFDWRSLKKYTSPQAADDLNSFLEKLPQNTSQTMLVIAGTAWAFAGAAGLYTTVQLQQLTELRASLQEADALKPMVPTIKNVSVAPSEVTEFVDKIQEVYKGLSIRANGSSIVISANTTASFGQFREAMGHIQSGGTGWRVRVDQMCVGRECGREPLSANLSINRVDIEAGT